MSNPYAPQDWASQQSTWQPKTWSRTPALSELMPPTPYTGAASGRQWTHGESAVNYATADALSSQRSIGDIFDGCTSKTEMTAFMVATKTDSLWRGVGIGVIVGATLVGGALWFLRK